MKKPMRSNRLDARLIFPILTLGWFIVVLVLSLKYPYSARLFPLIVSGIALPMVIFIILGRIVPSVSKVFNRIEGSSVFDTTMADGKVSQVGDVAESQLQTSTVIRVILWFCLYTGMFFLLGYLPAAIVFLFFFMKFSVRRSWKGSIAITAGVVLPLWLIFSFFLRLSELSDFIQ
ncbi:tripartite tricarboxylate transporter TctB family protein [Chloroflexota bacterium]